MANGHLTYGLLTSKLVRSLPSAGTPVPREGQTRREAGAQNLRACDDERAGSRVAERRGGEEESLWRVAPSTSSPPLWKEAVLMLRVMVRSKVTWGAVITALVAGSALLLMLTSQSLYPHPAQAAPQPPPPKTVLAGPATGPVEFRTLNEAASTVELDTGTKLPVAKPVSIVLERKADNNTRLSDWHQMARRGDSHAFQDVTLTYFDSSGQATVRLHLVNAWPSEYRLTQKGGELVEEVTLTADESLRQAPQ